ncbi:MAG: dockerin type I repeat-containing protein [Bacteroidaceae bacterium]|nr:dockerin type I repeat-containing protein [Bacteroidaceae bacterium]
MKTRIMMLLTLLLPMVGAVAQNTVSIGNAEMEYLSLGQSVDLPVMMENADDIVAVELSVKLPRGGRINTDGCQLTAARADGHQLSAACIDADNNVYKVTAFSASNKSFKGNSGQLMTLDVVTSQDWLDGRTYAVTVTKALLCLSNGDNVCTSSENGAIVIPNTPHANISFDVTGIVTTVKKDSVNTFMLGITNTGTATTGPISLQLPDWMSLQGALMPIESGQTATAVIAMSPKGEANTRYDGYIGINIENGNNQILPYDVTIVSDAKGTVVFSVCDEYTYYEADAPKVQNASIEMRNALTGEVVATLNTGTTGTATTTQVEGYYEYTVTAEGHETYTNNILIYPGQTTERTVNLSIGDGINIEYRVVETEEGDGYEIVTEATLEVAVPAPQVTISAPGRVKMSDVAVGEHVDVQVTLTNRGLIKARDVTLIVPEIEGFRWEALTPIVFDLRPQETSFILIRYTREEESDEGCVIEWRANYTWKCGDEPKGREIYAYTSIGDNCKPLLPGNCTMATIVEDEDVIVTVKLQFNQLLTLTRQAFEGTLTIENGSEKPMEDILLALTERMPNGELATDREFDISFTELTGFTGGVSGPWTLDAGRTGVLKVKFVPTKYAAPIAAIDYVFGGSLTFSVDGKERHADLTEQLMTVKPTPELNLDYFMQRDIIADDAITKDVVEPSEEAEFAVLISNIGYGDAENLRMVTAQPEMVDNEESLFLQYSITSSQLNGQEKSLAFGKSVTTDFGTLPAHGHAYAQWWMTSSLLGHFIEYNTSYTQLTLSQNPNLSLLNRVRIHELIRSIVVEGNSNADCGWAVNGEEDSQNLPDTLYLSDGTQEPIAIGTATMLEGSPFEYTLSLEPSAAGWNYAKVADPTGGNATITEVVREDGTVLPLRNIWQTWATLPDKKRATHENLIHIIDNCKNETCTYTIRFTPKPSATLNIISVKLNGMEANTDVSVSNTEVQSVEVIFTADIQELLPKAITLVNQGEVVDMTDVQYAIDGNKLMVDLSRIPHNDGFYCLTVNTALIVDVDGHVGLTATPVSWIEQTDKPVQLNLAYNFPNAATVVVLAEEYHGVKTVYDTPQTPADAYKYGTTLTLQVIPAYGYAFNRWSIDGNILSGETTYEYYLSANKELKLFFDREAFNLTVSNIVNNDEDDLTAGGTVMGGGSGYYEYGEEVTLTAQPDRCYKFVGWFTDAEAGDGKPNGLRRAAPLDGLTLLTTDSTYVYTIGGEMKLYPVFHRMGDVNGDNRFSIADVVLEANYIKDGSAENFAQDEADANGDGQITISDVVEIANSVKSK